MPLALITLSEEGLRVAERLKPNLGEDADLFLLEKLCEKLYKEKPYAKPFSEGIHTLVGEIFGKYNGLVFIMALGIVVRAIAPHIKDKLSDPAVVVVDDVGRFVISVLSGHEGGANDLALKVANILHGDAVITTGTEAKKDIIVGVGCRADISSEAIKEAILSSLRACNIPLERVRLVATIEERAGVSGLCGGVRELGIPLKVISKEEINTCEKEFSRSEFVKERIGVWGVCEPAAFLAGRKTKLILKKQKFPGVTVAIAQENLTW
ncbi:MAG: cobalt-precorrin 5A hydrolase [Candidatus Brocadiales bacterium]